MCSSSNPRFIAGHCIDANELRAKAARADYATENFRIAEMHNILTNTKSLIAGQITANQRTESLWRLLLRALTDEAKYIFPRPFCHSNREHGNYATNQSVELYYV
ncbi:hypothetical protein CHS0354_019994 [Potamilus streckersoni]|uniref:Uncharacterized protein n=1 Tax=Potamilus streckersoni TaxID=2493646 RepID=A0AAE0VQC7_9BIVA|nr:hypothetical protein CHS0354_019994 [Potamilus streckersoni]